MRFYTDNSKGRARSVSNSSSTKDTENSEPKTSGISRTRLPLSEARLYFAPAVVDAENVDFSDRLTAKQKSYKVSSRRQRYPDDAHKYGDFSDEEDGESLERKLARLKREIEEIKEECNRRKCEGTNFSEAETKNDTDKFDSHVSELSEALYGISLGQVAGRKIANGEFSRDLGTGIMANVTPQHSQGSDKTATYTVTYAPSYQQSHALAKAAEFDGRLAFLEKTLGINRSDISLFSPNGTQAAILPSIAKLQRQISVISQCTPSSLDSMSRHIRNLIQEAEKLESLRKVENITRETPQNTDDTTPDYKRNPEIIAKINSLYGTLPTIEKLGPILPPLLDRLRSLRAIHADAATTKTALDQIDKDQVSIAEEIKQWRDDLESMEKTISDAQMTMERNMSVMDGWIKTLEEKMMSL